MGIVAVLWEKWVEFRRDFYKITIAAMIAPLMYLLVFSLGIQISSHGEPYLNFLIPGVVALTTMNGSFNAIAQSLNVQRLYERAFDQVMISPTPLWQFVLGQIVAGALRGRGDSTAPMAIMLLTFVGLRQTYLFIMTHFISNTPMAVGFGYPVGWMACCVIEVTYYFVKWGRKRPEMLQDVQ